MDKNVVIFMSTDGGHSYRQTRVTERAFKEKLWIIACKWLRPDSEMSREKYGSSIIIRRHDTMSHIVTLGITGGDNLAEIWDNICQAWQMVEHCYR